MSSISHILCAVDFSESARHALAQAAAVAQAYDAGVTVLYAVVNRPSIDLPPVSLGDAEQERLVEDLRHFSESVAPSLSASYSVREAVSAHDAILDAVDDIDPDLLVMGTHGRSGFRRLFLGSVTEKVIRSVPCPTLVVPPAVSPSIDTPTRFRRLLCAVDLSESSLAALARALDLAQETAAQVLVLHVVEMPLAPPELPPDMDLSAMADRAAKEAVRRLQELIPAHAGRRCTIETPIVYGRAYREIVRVAAERHADVIVMGVHGRGPMDLMLFGSTTHHVLRASTFPVLVVHSEDGAAALRQFREQDRRLRPVQAD